jgi:hypothetical protein
VERAIVRFVSTVAPLTVLLFSGCAYLEPYVPLDPLASPKPPTPRAALTTGAMPNVEHAMQELDAWQQITSTKHNDLSKTIRTLNVATFGLAAGAVVAPVYNAYKDLVSALAIGAAATYSANTLFTPVDQVGLYNTAQDAFTCISNRGHRLLSAISPDKSAATFDATFADYRDSVCVCAMKPAFQSMEDAYEATRDSFVRALNADYGAGTQLEDAGRNVAIALNREIDNRAASPAAIFAAAKSLAPLSVPASSGAKDSTASNRQPAIRTRITACAAAPGPPCSDADLARIATETNAYVDRKKKIDGALDGIVQLDSACNFNPTPVPDLTVSQDSVTLAASAFVNIVISGGRAPYVKVWEGADPSANGITAELILPSTVRISAAALTTAGGPYILDIQDSSVSGRVKKITVTAK